MSRFFDTFGDKHVFMPVIHVQNTAQAIENVRIAIDAGADGVFLVNQGRGGINLPGEWLIETCRAVREVFPSFWIGLNRLGLDRQAIDATMSEIPGIWTDEAGINEEGANHEAGAFLIDRQASDWRGIYFAGIGIKYPFVAQKIAAAAKNAVPYVDVITTIGGTSTSIVKGVRREIGTHPIAVVGGVEAENVRALKPFVNCFMPSQSISHSFHWLDRRKVETFAKEVGK